MESYLLDILRDRQEKSLRDDRSGGTYACFFHLGRGERTDTKLSSERIRRSMLIAGFRSQHMRK